MASDSTYTSCLSDTGALVLLRVKKGACNGAVVVNNRAIHESQFEEDTKRLGTHRERKLVVWKLR